MAGASNNVRIIFWEHKYVPNKYEITVDEFLEAINKEGKDGWQFCSTVSCGGVEYLILKRQVLSRNGMPLGCR